MGFRVEGEPAASWRLREAEARGALELKMHLLLVSWHSVKMS